MSLRETSSAPPRDLFPLIAAASSFLLLAYLSVARYQGYNAGMFDLGNMSQAIWSATQGQPLLYSRPEGFSLSRLAGHVELIYYLLALPYALWPDPRLLLLLQAGLFALGALPAYRLALRRFAPGAENTEKHDVGELSSPTPPHLHAQAVFAARCAALIYLLYPAALTGVLFDLHGDTLALPLLMFALEALDARAWRRYALFVALALLCKFYIAAAIAGIGGVLLVWEGRRLAGALTLGAALAYGALTFLVLRPAFVPPAFGGVAAVSGSYLSYYFGQLDELRETLGLRLLNALVVFGPALLVAWRAWRWLLPGLPIAAAAMISTGPGGAYDYRYHHYAVAVPFIVMAVIVGAARLRGANEAARRRGERIRRSWRGDLGLTAGVVAICAALLVDTPLNPLFWLRIPGYGLDPSVYGVTARDSLKDRFLAERVPPGAPLAASNFLAAHLTSRQTLYLLRYPEESAGPERLPHLLPQVDYALADALFDFYLPLDEGYAGGLDGDRAAIGLLLSSPDFGLTEMRDGLLLFERGAPPERALSNQIATRPDDGAAAERQFGAAVELVRHSVEQVGPGRLRASFTWRVRDGFGRGRFAAVSRLEGVDGARFVHLPGYALRPAWEWPTGELIEETFEVALPPDIAPGSYVWRTGWHSVSAPFAYATDERSLLPGSEEAALGAVMIR